jgi:hypothetical protein
MSQRPTGPACGNNPNYRMSDGDRQAVEDFRAYLADRAQEKTMANRYVLHPFHIEAVQWTDTNAPELETFAGDRFMTLDPQDRIEDPDATAALRESFHETWKLLHPGAWVIKRPDGLFITLGDEQFRETYRPDADQATPSRRAGLHDELVKALGLIKTVPPVAHRREQADHVLGVLYREWPWLRAEAEDTAPAEPAADRAADAWVPCSPKWLAANPGQCAAAPRLAGPEGISHLHPAVLAVLPAPTDRAAVLREAADRMVTEVQQTMRTTPGDARLPGLLAAIEGLRRMADEAQSDETDEERADRQETERDHSSGNHRYCGVTCEAEFPSDMLRNTILYRAIPGSKAMLAELERRAAETSTDVGLSVRLEAALTERYTELGNPFSEMRRREQGPDGWPASHPVGPHHVAEVLRELLAADEPAAGARQDGARS